MNKAVLFFVVVILAFGASFLWIRSDVLPRNRSQDPPIVFGVIDEHQVTPEMEEVTEAMADRRAPAFKTVGHDQKIYDSSAIFGNKPVLILFIQDGCPCSVSAEPFYHRLFAAYGDDATFLGIIDGDPEVAQAWVERLETPFPVLCDPDLEIVRDYQVWNSAYAALIDQEGQIVRVWPGYSEEILEEIATSLVTIAGAEKVALNFGEAPELPYSGCPFLIEFEAISTGASEEEETLSESLE